jgi:hypothetical protein
MDLSARRNLDPPTRRDVVEPIRLVDKMSTENAPYSCIAIIMSIYLILSTCVQQISMIPSANMRGISRTSPTCLSCGRLRVSAGLYGLPGDPLAESHGARSRLAVVQRGYQIPRGGYPRQALAFAIGASGPCSASEGSGVERVIVGAKGVPVYDAFQLDPFSQGGK